MFRTVALSIIRSFSLYTAMVYGIQLVSRTRTERPDPAHKLCAIYHCCVQ